jgi:hypothetical protein
VDSWKQNLLYLPGLVDVECISFSPWVFGESLCINLLLILFAETSFECMSQSNRLVTNSLLLL